MEPLFMNGFNPFKNKKLDFDFQKLKRLLHLRETTKLIAFKIKNIKKVLTRAGIHIYYGMRAEAKPLFLW